MRPTVESDKQKASAAMVDLKLILVFTLIFAVTVQGGQRRGPFVKDSSESESEIASSSTESELSEKVNEH
jgi:hypothetical protein